MSSILRWSQRTELSLDESKDASDPFALNMVVRQHDALTHADVLVAVASGVVELLRQERWDDAVTQWSSRRIRKILRRAKGSRWNQLSSLEGFTVSRDSADVFFYPPTRRAALPREIARLQVSGLDIAPSQPTGSSASEAPCLEIAVNPAARLTTGKAAAAAGHISHLAVLHSDTGILSAWENARFPIRLREWSEDPDIEVQDAGFTEVEPGTTTARGWWA